MIRFLIKLANFTIVFLCPYYIQAEQPLKNVSLISRYSTCAKDAPCELGFLFDLNPGWHIYWKNPGDSGAPPKFKYLSPAHFDQIQINWPVPSVFAVGHLVNFGYKETVVLPFFVDPNNFDSNINLLISAEWLVCKEDCIPQDKEFSISIPIGKELVKSSYEHLFSNIQYPIESNAIGLLEDNLIKVILSYPEKDKIYFFSEDKSLVESNQKPSILVEDNKTTLTLIANSSFKAKDTYALIKTKDKTYRVLIKPTYKDTPTTNLHDFLIVSFLLALIGGILLNLMPCVLPIVAIKAISFSKNKELSTNKKIISAIFYLLGVVFSILSLYLVVIVAKYSGISLGWGFQLQNPYFAFFFAIFFVLIALNLLGIFEVPLFFSQKLLTLDGKSIASKNFFSGIVTTLVSTPCTAPFAGATIAYALQSTNLEGFVIFIGLGIGLALPFITVILVPGFSKLIPKPGRWMVTFKRICAVPMLIAAVWLFWVVSLQTINVYDRSQVYTDSWQQTWVPYSKEDLSRFIEENKTIYLDFTAAWCITCQVNKTLVFQNKEVKDFIKKNKVILMRADWTNNDPNITQALKEYGRASVPLNVIYKGQNKYILPTLLSPAIVLDVLSQ